MLAARPARDRFRGRHGQPCPRWRRPGTWPRPRRAARCSGFTARSRCCWRRPTSCASGWSAARTARPSTPTRRSAARTGCSRTLADLPSFKAVPRYLPGHRGSGARSLRGLGGAGGRLVAVRTREMNAQRPGALDGVETSDHLARLWAFDRIDALLHPASGAPPPRPTASRRWRSRRRYHLVTAVSGAVVLDSQAETDAWSRPAIRTATSRPSPSPRPGRCSRWSPGAVAGGPRAAAAGRRGDAACELVNPPHAASR